VIKKKRGPFRGVYNGYARAGMNACGMHPFNPNWVQDHSEVFSISDVVFNTAVGSNNHKLATICVEENVVDLPAARTLDFARRLLAHPKMDDIMAMIQHETSLSATNFKEMILRVANSEYMNNSLDSVMERPWWKKMLIEFKEHEPDRESYSSDDSDSSSEACSDQEEEIATDNTTANISEKKKKRKYGNSALTSWGEGKALAIDLNSDARLEQLQLAEALAITAAEESARKKQLREEISAAKTSELNLKLSNQSSVVSKLLKVGGWVANNFIVSKTLLTKKLLLKVVTVHGQTQGCRTFAEAQLNTAFTSKQGLHSAIVTQDIIVAFLNSI